MTPEVRRVLEAQNHFIKEMAADLCESAKAQTETGLALIEVAEQSGDTNRQLGDIHRTLQTLTAQTVELTQRLNQYLDSAAREDGKIRARLTQLEAQRAQR